jgi:adenine-specific DNA-methyltransferase
VANLRDTEFGTALDYFAGSGTTGHAVINLNREDGGRRKFILVEMADYFDTVLLPRIKKVTFTPEWRDGKPKRMATPEEAERGPRIVKVIRLESYEDALDNIAFDDAAGQGALAFDDYLLKYMLQWETKGSETLLNVDRLARPFDYKLQVHRDGETRDRLADIPETFNYLLGLHVQTRRAYDDGGRRYLVDRGLIDRRQVAVIWRDTEGWEQADYERDRQFVAEQKLAEGADEVFVNGDSFIPGARALEPIFKARMFAPVE